MLRSHSLYSLLFFICNMAQNIHFVMSNNDSFEESQIPSKGSRLFQRNSFSNKPIEKPKMKRLKNIDLYAELPLCEQSNVIKQIMRLEDMQ